MPIVLPSPGHSTALEAVLRRRGHLPAKQGDIKQTLYPGDALNEVLYKLGQFKYVEYFGQHPLQVYMSYFENASFRKMVRTLLRDNRSWKLLSNLKMNAGVSTEEYLLFLSRLLLIERRNEEVRLTREIDNLGPSLEHYVAHLCIRDLSGSAEWGVTLKELPRAGGDYDVLAWLDPSLIYVECKSGRPSDISESQVREFLQRSVELAPDLAIFLVDTADTLTPLVESRFNRVLRDVLGDDESSRPLSLLHDYPRVHFGFSRVYVTGSHTTILHQLRLCLQHHYARIITRPHWGKGPWNFLGTPVRNDT